MQLAGDLGPGEAAGLVEAARKGGSRSQRWTVLRVTPAAWNSEDSAPGRQVWYRYWDTCITNERSFCARVNYIHMNPVKHRLVDRPEDYPYSSCRVWAEGTDMEVFGREFPCDLLDLEY